MISQQEEWMQWRPLPDTANKYFLKGILDRAYGIEIELSELKNGGNRLLISFGPGIYSYRTCDETLRTSLMYSLGKKYGGSFFGHWTFFTVKNSHYVKHLAQSADESEDLSDLVHYSLFTADSVTDIVTASEPRVILNTIGVGASR